MILEGTLALERMPSNISASLLDPVSLFALIGPQPSIPAYLVADLPIGGRTGRRDGSDRLFLGRLARFVVGSARLGVTAPRRYLLASSC
jgi:hypothetical protein